MENLHLKNLKHNNIEKIKQTTWIKSFNPEQQYYIESGLENEINITSFAKKEINPEEMYNILKKLEKYKYNELRTLPYHMFKTHEKVMQKLGKNSAYGIKYLNINKL